MAPSISSILALDRWKRRARDLRAEIYALYMAYRDPRTPWYARLFALCLVGYAFSPIDLIPDPIPILGYLDDLVILPLGVLLALRMIPREVMDDSRKRARETIRQGRPTSWVAGLIIIVIWLLLAALAVTILLRTIT